MKTLFYKRQLPHIQSQNGAFFVTFRLKMKLPETIAKQMRKFYHLKNGKRITPGWSAFTEFFNEFDNFLDFTKNGPKHLASKKVADIVADAMHFRDNNVYNLICYSIMSNHVHMVICDTQAYLWKIMQSLKRYTGRISNKALNRSGSFWQPEYYDHLIRDESDMQNCIRYTVNNPVKAVLVKNWTDWRYTYLNEEYRSYISG